MLMHMYLCGGHLRCVAKTISAATCWLIVHVCLLTLHCLEHCNAAPFLRKYLLNPFTSVRICFFLISNGMGTTYIWKLIIVTKLLLHCMQGFFLSFFKTIFIRKLFQEYHHSLKQFGSNSSSALGRT